MASQLLRRGLPRDLRATTYLIGFVVVTVATVLITRGVLAASGYPQLGGSGLHIAHVLWGGLVMAVAMVVVLSFAGPVARPFAAFIGGIGFGLFIDEVGKYVTSNNDYFYKPAATIIYVTVVVLVLVIHWVHGRRAPAPGELLAGALGEATGGAGGGISDGRRERALTLARRAGDAPGAPETTALLDALPPSHTELGDPMTWIGDRARRFGARFLDTKWARVTTVVILCTIAILNLLAAAATGILDLFVPEQVDNPHNVATFGEFFAALIASICIVIGLRHLRRDPHTAYSWFERGVLVDLLLTQPFSVAADQFSVVPGVIVDLLMLVVLGAARAGHDRDRAWARTPAVESAGARV